MNLKYSLCCLALMVFSRAYSQSNIKVKSFNPLVNDLDARAYEVKQDQNGDKCAILKFVTPETGFVFEGGSLGIVEVVQKVGEIWVYVPHGIKRISIKHQEYGIMRNYIFPQAITEANVYELVLTTDAGGASNIDGEWVIINSFPEGAKLYINDYYMGTTPFQKKYKEGEYKYRLEKENFQKVEDKFILDYDKGVVNLRVNMIGENIRVKFDVFPLGVKLMIDTVNATSLNDSIVVKAGSHNISGMKEGYISKSENVFFDDRHNSYTLVLMPKEYRSKATSLAYSLVIPGAGQAYLKRQNSYYIPGGVAYGLLGVSLLKHRAAVKNYDLYLAATNTKDLEDYKVKWQSDISLSRTMGFAALGIWAGGIVWNLLMPSEKEMYNKFSMSTNNIDGLKGCGLSMVYNF